jgi:hypothetical protein
MPDPVALLLKARLEADVKVLSSSQDGSGKARKRPAQNLTKPAQSPRGMAWLRDSDTAGSMQLEAARPSAFLQYAFRCSHCQYWPRDGICRA